MSKTRKNAQLVWYKARKYGQCSSCIFCISSGHGRPRAGSQDPAQEAKAAKTPGSPMSPTATHPHYSSQAPHCSAPAPQLHTQTTEYKSCTAAYSTLQNHSPHNSTPKPGHTNAAQQHSPHWPGTASNTLTLQHRSPTHAAPQAALTTPTLQLPARAEEEITIHFQDPFSIDQFCL